MEPVRRALAAVLFALLPACGGPFPGEDGGTDAMTPGDSARADATEVAGDATMDVPTDSPSSAVTADQLLAFTTSCMQIAGTPLYSTDSGSPADIPLCQLNGAIFWQADMDIDCDGGSSALCMSDPYYQPDTSGTTSTGQPLDASTLPFIVIPLPRPGFDYRNYDIHIGSVAAVIYQHRLVYAIFGDAGPSTIIGEGSNALAVALGIDGDPNTGGVDSGVTYIVFTGSTGQATHNEDHDEATRIGELRAAQLVSGP